MYEDYEVVEGGWRLPSSKSFLPGTILRDRKSNIRYKAVKVSADMKEANRASKRNRIWSEVETAAAWTAFLPILGAALKVWVVFNEKETFNILDVWETVDVWMFLLAAGTVVLFATSIVATAMQKKYARAVKRHLKESHYWEVVEESSLLDNPYPELKGLARTEEEIALLKKEDALEKLLGPELDRKAIQKENLNPVSENDYL